MFILKLWFVCCKSSSKCNNFVFLCCWY